MLTQADVLGDWGNILLRSFDTVFQGVATTIPRIVGALLIFIIGWVIAVAISRLVQQVVRSLKVDNALDKLGARQAVERGGLKLDSGAFLGGLIKWFIILIFVLTAVDILGLSEVSQFLTDVLLYLPRVVIAAVILLAAALVADVVYRVVKASAEAAHLKGAFVAGVAKWSIWVFAVLVSLVQLQLPGMETLFTGLVGMLAIAGGLAFGMGGKEHAQQFLEILKKDITG